MLSSIVLTLLAGSAAARSVILPVIGKTPSAEFLSKGIYYTPGKQVLTGTVNVYCISSSHQASTTDLSLLPRRALSAHISVELGLHHGGTL
jgi:hypothetical protein